MTTEQKARAYDEALKQIKECTPDENGFITIYPQEIFSELQESEDERIRKVIRGWIYTRPASFFDNGISKEEMLAWLEKQGEQKSKSKLQLSEELYEHIRNTCACIDDALNSETLKDINDYLSMAEYSANSAFDMIEKQGEQKSAWSEEDECYMSECIGAIAIKDGWSFEEKRKTKHWLKSLKKRIEDKI